MYYLCHICKRMHYQEDMAVIDDNGLNVCVFCYRVWQGAKAWWR